MTKEQLLSKWSALGTLAALQDTWMVPCYAEDVALGVDADDLLLHGREQWEATDHFQILYGGPMLNDAVNHLGEHGNSAAEIAVELKMDLADTFWDAWETEHDAPSLIQEALEGRIKTLAATMLDMLEITHYAGPAIVGFTSKAITEQSPAFQALSKTIHHMDMGHNFIFDQVLYALDFIAANGLVEDIESQASAPDVYAENLTAWLAESNYHIGYVSEAMRQSIFHLDAIGLLQAAQRRAIQDIWRAVVDMLWNLLK